MKQTALIALLVFLTSACTRPASTPAPEPSPTGELRLCSASDLQTSSSSNEAGGSSELGVTLVNASKSPCVLVGPPQVALIGNGQPLDLQITQADPASPSPTALTVSPGESAIAILDWRNYCGAALTDGPIIHLGLTTDESLDIKTGVEAVPRCDARDKPSTLSVQRYSYPP